MRHPGVLTTFHFYSADWTRDHLLPHNGGREVKDVTETAQSRMCRGVNVSTHGDLGLAQKMRSSLISHGKNVKMT